MTQLFFILALLSLCFFVLTIMAAANSPSNGAGVVSIGALIAAPVFLLLGIGSWLFG